LENRLLMSTYTVNTLSASLSPGAGLISLPEAVADVNSHSGADTINFSTSVFSAGSLHTITLGAALKLTDTSGATTIDGPGAGVLAVSGGNKVRVFQDSAGIVATIENLTVTKGNAPSSGNNGGIAIGGGIENSGTLTLINCTITGNAVSPSGTDIANAAEGGGIFSNGKLTVQGCTISSNIARGYGQTENGYGGGIYSTASLTITSSVITLNTAEGSDSFGLSSPNGNAVGGGVYATGALTATNTTFSKNTANGGSNDTANGGGNAEAGAIYTTATSTITGATITGNTAVGEDAYGGPGPNAAAVGGGILNKGNLTISASTISNNLSDSSIGERGTVQPAEGGGIDNTGTLTIKTSTVSGNSASGGGGESAYAGSGGGAGSNAYGGGINSAGTLVVSQCAIVGNSAKGEPGGTTEYHNAGPGGGAFGGGISAIGAATVTDTTIANNSAVGGVGGGDTVGQAGAGANGGNGDGGGIYAFSTLKVFDSTISGNSAAAGNGGVGYHYPGNSSPPLPPGVVGHASGAGLFVAHPSSTLDNTIVSANKIGAVFNDIGNAVVSTSSNNLIGVGGGLTNGTHGNKVGITNPVLSPLGNFGGSTQTMLPLPGSPALGAGSVSLVPSGVTTDQRGQTRVVNGKVDIGSVEIQKNTPFKGSPAAFGLIQAENFDLGGPGAGYYNPQNVNKGGVYRTTEGASIIPIPSADGGGFALGYTLPTEFFNYTVSVAATGTYILQFRTAFQPKGGTFHLNIDGVNVTGELTVPSTGDYNKYTTISKTGVKINAGTHVLQLVIDSAGTGVPYAGNFDWIQAVKT
jgi:hypothetical protein